MSDERVKPLFEDASASPALRDFVAMARSDGPTQSELDQLAKGLAPVLGVSAGVAIAGQAAAIGSAPVTVASGASSLTGALPSAAGTGAAGTAGAAGGAAVAAAKAAGVGAAAVKTGVGSAVVKAGLLSQLFASTSAKLVALGVGVSVASVGAWELQHGGEARPSAPAVQVQAPPQPQAEAAREVRAPQPAPRAAAEPVAEPPAEPAPAAVEEPRSLPRRRALSTPPATQLEAVVEPAQAPEPAPAPAVVEPAPAEPLPSELALIRQAQAARVNSGQALALLAQHRQQYPRGALAQEREVLAIEILLKAGLKVEAEARAREFEASYRGSAHLPHVKALLQRAGAQ